jgi:hypothetical protein
MPQAKPARCASARAPPDSVLWQGEQSLGDLFEVVARHIRWGEHVAVCTFESCAPAGEAPGPFGAVAVPGVNRDEGEPMRRNAEGLGRDVVNGGGGLPRPHLLGGHHMVYVRGEAGLLQELGSGIRMSNREATDA